MANGLGEKLVQNMGVGSARCLSCGRQSHEIVVLDGSQKCLGWQGQRHYNWINIESFLHLDVLRLGGTKRTVNVTA